VLIPREAAHPFRDILIVPDNTKAAVIKACL
jgi:hypothetical protein